jgi:hypothetical protein
MFNLQSNRVWKKSSSKRIQDLQKAAHCKNLLSIMCKHCRKRQNYLGYRVDIQKITTVLINDMYSTVLRRQS